MGVVQVIRGFFLEPWHRPQPALSPAQQIWMLAATGFTLKASGQLRDATTPLEKALSDRRDQLRSADDDHRDELASSAAQIADDLAMLYLTLGDLHEAAKYSSESLDLCPRNTVRHTSYLTSMGAILHHLGRWEESERFFVQAEREHAKRSRGTGWMQSYQAFRYCDLLLDLGRWWDALPRARHALEKDLEERQPLSLALGRLSLGRALIQEGIESGRGVSDEARDNIERAVVRMREAGRRDVLPNALLAAASMHRLTGDLDKAREDLDEMQKVASTHEMALHSADADLELARVALAAGNRVNARHHLDSAAGIVDRFSYGRRKDIVAELRDAEDDLDRPLTD
jgi:tetratricopeptide (TPR) repeat protein